MNVIGPVLVAILYIAACSFLREPNRRNFNAIMIAGAGAAYLSGGFGRWEFAFTAIVTYFAYQGLRSYNFIGIGWLFHTGWDTAPFIRESYRSIRSNLISRLCHLRSSDRDLVFCRCSFRV